MRMILFLTNNSLHREKYISCEAIKQLTSHSLSLLYVAKPIELEKLVFNVIYIFFELLIAGKMPAEVTNTRR
jgi:hypothetical protein